MTRKEGTCGAKHPEHEVYCGYKEGVPHVFHFRYVRVGEEYEWTNENFVEPERPSSSRRRRQIEKGLWKAALLTRIGLAHEKHDSNPSPLRYQPVSEVLLSDGVCRFLEVEILVALARVYPEGYTDDRLARILNTQNVNLSQVSASRRQLVKVGLVEPRGLSSNAQGREVLRYVLTDAAVRIFDESYASQGLGDQRWEMNKVTASLVDIGR